MSNHSPIPSPPPELVEQWEQQFLERPTMNGCFVQSYIATKAAQWGADQELEACVEWLDRNSPVIGGFHLRIDRRPKPPSRKEQALEAIGRLCASVIHDDLKNDAATIRRALEGLDDQPH